MQIIPAQDKVRFAVIGCGHIGKRHAEMIEQNPEAELVGLCDIKKKEDLALNTFSKVPFYASIDDLLANTECDVINVCTPNG